MTHSRISVDMSTNPPTVTTIPFTAAEEEAETQNEAADAALAQTQTASAARLATFTGDSSRAQILSLLQTSSPAQIRNFVQNQVTDLPSARTLLANLLVLIALDSRS